MAQEQDLTKGVFTLTLQPGRIAYIHFAEPVSYRARSWNAVPARSGDILNLRDIEQALENFKRVPNIEVDIQIVPGAQEATSDMLIAWKESRPFHLSLGSDDCGSDSIGKYHGSTTLSIDAPFAQNDLFYVNLGRCLFRDGPYDRRSNTMNYTLPVDYWSFSANYNYHQNIANANEILTYSGKSENAQFTVSRLLFRNQVHKTTLNLRGYSRHQRWVYKRLLMKAWSVLLQPAILAVLSDAAAVPSLRCISLIIKGLHLVRSVSSLGKPI